MSKINIACGRRRENSMDNNYILTYQTPSKEWMEGLPIGNGRLAAMVWGEDEDIISLNHERLWRGITRERDNITVPDGVLKQIRELVDQEEFFRATSLANTWLAGSGAGISRLKNRIDSYQPAGDLCFCLSDVRKYCGRKLNIFEGIAEVERETNSGNRVKLTTFVDAAGGPVSCWWESDEPFDGEIYFRRAEDENASETCVYAENEINYSCAFDGGICYKVKVALKSDGRITSDDSGIKVSKVKNVIAFIDIAVFNNAVMGDAPELGNLDLGEILAQHTKIFRAEMEKFKLRINTADVDLPTDERLRLFKSGEYDDGLVLLFYHYGRYLFLSSNISGELPANLQGKWNESINPPWGSDYHLNINLQMNYWMAEPLGMSECADKLLNLIDNFVPHAIKAARDLYGTRGLWLPHATDVWGRATPESYGYAVWIGAAPWIAQHYWTHYVYNGDKRFLSERAYPFFREVALFIEDYVTRDENGVYQIVPSQSPENAFACVGLFPISIGKSSAIDVQLAYDALGYAIDASEILNVDKGERIRWIKIRNQLPEFKIGEDGRLLEWDREREEKEPGHRHLSHLYGLYPSDLFSKEVRPEQYEAASKSLEYRISQGGGHTGWSRAWTACLYARLGEGEKVYENITAMINEFATSTLLDLHPPKIFQIDGNFGAVAALTECVAQFRNNKLYLLCALPKAWNTGEIFGLKTPGGHRVDFCWSDREVKHMWITFGFAEQLTVVINGTEITLTGKEGESLHWQKQ